MKRMKKIFVVLGILVLVIFSQNAYAVTEVELQWDHSIDRPYLDNYKVYYGTATRDYDPAIADYAAEYSIDGGIIWEPAPSTPTIFVDVDITGIMLRGLTDDETYFFAVTAIDTRGLESDYSNEVNTDDVSDEPGSLKMIDNSAGSLGESWCWDWSLSPNLDGYHFCWARTRADLNSMVADIIAGSSPTENHQFVQTNCIRFECPAFWMVTHVAVIAEDIEGEKSSPAYGHYLYGDIYNTYNDGFTYEETAVDHQDHNYIAFYYGWSVPYPEPMYFIDGMTYDLPAITQLELCNLYQDGSLLINHYDLMMFGWFCFGTSGTD